MGPSRPGRGGGAATRGDDRRRLGTRGGTQEGAQKRKSRKGRPDQQKRETEPRTQSPKARPSCHGRGCQTVGGERHRENGRRRAPAPAGGPTVGVTGRARRFPGARRKGGRASLPPTSYHPPLPSSAPPTRLSTSPPPVTPARRAALRPHSRPPPRPALPPHLDPNHCQWWAAARHWRSSMRSARPRVGWPQAEEGAGGERGEPPPRAATATHSHGLEHDGHQRTAAAAATAAAVAATAAAAVAAAAADVQLPPRRPPSPSPAANHRRRHHRRRPPDGTHPGRPPARHAAAPAMPPPPPPPLTPPAARAPGAEGGGEKRGRRHASPVATYILGVGGRRRGGRGQRGGWRAAATALTAAAAAAPWPCRTSSRRATISAAHRGAARAASVGGGR